MVVLQLPVGRYYLQKLPKLNSGKLGVVKQQNNLEIRLGRVQKH